MTKEEAISIMKVIVHMLEEKYDTDRVEDAVDMAIEALQQEPKTGHWIEVTNGRGGHECDFCHTYAPSYQDGDEYLTNYCPYCGAKMTESEQMPKSEWEHDHDILRAYSDGANEVLDKIRVEIEQEPYVSKMEVLDILDKYKAESEG